MFLSTHYAGDDLVPKFRDGEPWKKVFGPVFIYLNSGMVGSDSLLWQDAKSQMILEVQSWPYDFPASADFPTADERGSLSGRLMVKDRHVLYIYYPSDTKCFFIILPIWYVSREALSADTAYVGLAPPGEVGSWQRECKGYQFWTKADCDGSFTISHVRLGSYNLYAWVPGFIGDYKYDLIVNISSGGRIDLGNLVYEPPRDGPTLWEIGIPDRSAAEFYVPDPNPNYVNKLYVNHPDKFRQYGLWERYADLFPAEDLVYKIGAGNDARDWFFAQVTRLKNSTYQPTTWQIKFKLDAVSQSGTYKLRIALASATDSDLQAYFQAHALQFR
ncbi:Rhamnogalacturonate lyase [Nymphaea thermarum]|nr:Rhamnogalacturonate lyase [Nymphaea thermarum]